jgi:hypothetical protein
MSNPNQDQPILASPAKNVSRIGRQYLTERQAEFCRNYADIRSETFQNANSSAKKAGYNSRISAYELVRLPHIRERIEEIESEISAGCDWTVDVFRYEIVKCYKAVKAESANKPKYLEMIGKVKGFFNEQTSNTFVFANMDAATIAQRVQDIARKLSNANQLGINERASQSQGIQLGGEGFKNTTPPPENHKTSPIRDTPTTDFTQTSQLAIGNSTAIDSPQSADSVIINSPSANHTKNEGGHMSQGDQDLVNKKRKPAEPDTEPVVDPAPEPEPSPADEPTKPADPDVPDRDKDREDL